jgi:D-alanine--poly(phosphoribitol) ligase subunit 2
MGNRKIIENLIFSAVEEINAQLQDERQLKKSAKTMLFGRDGNLDSLGLVNLLVAIEQNIEDEFDVSLTIADERAMSQKNSPFRTVGSWTGYIEKLLEEKPND